MLRLTTPTGAPSGVTHRLLDGARPVIEHWHMLPTWLELRVALRTLRRSKAFATFSVLALALAIAANTTMSSLIDGLLWPEVTFQHPNQLLVAHFTAPHTTLYPNVHTQQVLGDSGRTYSGVAWWQGQPWGVGLDVNGEIRVASMVTVPGNYFVVVGARALYGTLFHDSTAAAATEVVISERLWLSIRHGTQAFAPFTLHLRGFRDGEAATVVGVVANHGALPLHTDVFAAADITRGGDVLVRMRPGASRTRLLAELNALAPSIDPAHSRFAHFELRPAIVSPARHYGVVGALAAATLAVLLIACANIANLLLARGMSRARELATRLAFGASRLQVARMLFAESGLLAAAGGVLGLVLSLWTIHLVRAYLPSALQSTGLVEPQISWRVIAAGVGLTTLAALVFAGAPLVLLLRHDVHTLLKGAGSRHATANRSRFQLLVAVEVAGALVLVVSASLVGASAAKLVTPELGYDASHLVLAAVRDRRSAGAGGGAPPSREVIARRYDEMQRLAALPGVSGVTAQWWGNLTPRVRVDDPGGNDEQLVIGISQLAIVAPNFLRVMKIPVLHGRDFHQSEDDPIPSIIINQAAAHLLWPDADPIGRLLQFGGGRERGVPWMRVVGIIGSIALTNVCDGGACDVPTILIANGAGYPAATGATVYVLRGTAPAGPLVDRVRHRIAVDVPQASANVTTMRESLGLNTLAQMQDFVATLFGSFALVGLLLALIGVYGVSAYAVQRRAREFGVRVALGAQTRDIVTLVLRDGNATALLGIAAGLLAADWVAHLLQSFLLGVDKNEPYFLGVSVVLLFGATIAAGIPPALRASRVNPVDTLRSE